jgi:hypothetical protein
VRFDEFPKITIRYIEWCSAIRTWDGKRWRIISVFIREEAIPRISARIVFGIDAIVNAPVILTII